MTAAFAVTWKLLLAYLVYTSHTDSVKVTMTAGKAVMGKSGTIRCSAEFLTDEVHPELEIRVSRLDLQFVWSADLNNSWPDTDADRGKYSLDVVAAEESTVLLTLTIRDLACQDEGSYLCTATVLVVNTTLNVQSSQEVELRVEVPPTAPGQLVLSPQTSVVREHDWIDVECRAVVGHSDDTLLRWKLFQGNHSQLLLLRDPRIILQEDGVTEETMQLNMVPESEVKDGAAVSLVCRADGYPSVNYTWTRSPPLRLSRNVAVLTPDRNTSQLLIASFSSKNDTGIYKCTAWNWVLGVKLFTASQEIFLSSKSPAQKHSVLPKSATLNKLDPTELVLLGVAISAFSVFVITLLVVIITCVCRCRTRQRPASPKPLKSALRRPTEESETSAHSTETVSVSGSQQEAK